MGVLTRRSIYLTGLLLLLAPALFAGFPTARTEGRMVYDPTTTFMVLFGGAPPHDAATRTTYSLDDTWVWTGERWVQRFPEHKPSGRHGHVMVYDTARSRVVVFGGKRGIGELNDTWIYQDSDWSQLDTPNAPPARTLAGGAYDPIRDRIVVFGGDQNTENENTTTHVYDTWEFDGTTWRQTGSNGPQIVKPTLVYDAARNETLMMAVDPTVTVSPTANSTKMYRYNPEDGTWAAITPAALPPCANEAALAFQTHNNTVLLTGGVCANSDITDEAWEWNGENWAEIDNQDQITSRSLGHAMAYDDHRKLALLYGGTVAFSEMRASTLTLKDNRWTNVVDDTTPAPRSLAVFETDPANNVIWMLGGVNDQDAAINDFWKFANGQWEKMTTEGGPGGCVSPVGAFDTDRNRLVVVCANADVYEWDNAAWRRFTDFRTKPISRRFSSLTYDPVNRKSVLYGGFDETLYRNETWTWDGTTWTEVRSNRPPARALTSAWFDPVLRKVVIYGGVGRPRTQDRIVRYNDMWQFNGTQGWTQIKPATTPGMRYGAQVAVDPRTNKTILFGGLRLDINEEGIQSQVFAEDSWQWDGATWTRVELTGLGPRENGQFAYDPSLDQMVLFGGYAGYFFSDVWVLDGTAWKVREESLAPASRRRATSR